MFLSSSARAPARGRLWFPGRAVLALARDPLGFFTEAARTHGDVARLPLPFRPTYLLSHADHVREVFVAHADRFGRGLAIERAQIVLGRGLLTSDGDRHRRHRRLLQPGFALREVEAFVPAIAAAADEHARRWRDGETVDAAREMALLTLSAVARVMLGEELGGSAEAIARALDELLALSNRLVLPLPVPWLSLPLPSARRARAALTTLDGVIYDLIERKRRRGPGRDVLSTMMAARDSPDAAGRLTDRDLRDETMTLLLAGHETTACALTWTWHLLAEHPDVAARVRRDVEAALQGRLPGTEDLAALKYVEQVFAEAMRLFPPVWSVGRRALEDVPLGGGVVPAGSLVVLSQWVIHRDPRFWPEPARFDPDRFASSDRPRRPRAAYFPFGDGARRCIGESLAWTIGVTVLATLATRVRFERLPEYDVCPLSYLFLLYPGHRPRSAPRRRAARGLPMRVRLP